ncbi:hypothetical protein [Planococcus alpniumensis]|uniref:hypothetical protein n=1 Tax=Planococcus alpniumensis TaxID=2708345 RepID=UPI002013403C|nr:hypothetical protein [Planococcus sp. MSAK28401]
MKQIKDNEPPVITYFFTQSKDIHEENGKLFITLFIRLTREFTQTVGSELYKKTETVWVNIEELKLEKATKKMRALPNRINVYKTSKEVFLTLYKLAATCPEELYYVTPFSSCKRT